MGRVLVRGEGVSKAFAGATLLEGATFQIEECERVALVGPNGAGKSTLLRMIEGRERPDSGSLRLAPQTPVVVFEQHPRVPPGATVRDLLAATASAPAALAGELATLDERIGDPSLYESGEADAVLARYAEVKREIDRARVAASDVEGNPLVAELGIDLGKDASLLSGGERTRVFLAGTLASADRAGILVLDEPTNHLDLETIEWLEDRLLDFGGTCLLVAHDRAFLDNVATRVLAFERSTLASYPGNYSDFERARDEDAERLARRREREGRELARQKAVIEQFRHQKRFDGQMASRLTRLARYRSAIDRTPDPLLERVQFAVGFEETFKSSPEVVRVRGLGKKFGERILFYDLDFDLLKGDRVGLVGPNGVGKTTLLRILTGRDRKDVGTIEVAPGVKGSYYAQGSEGLDPARTLREEVLAARRHLSDEDVKALLGRFAFRHPNDPDRRVSTLSGGERARLALLKVVLAPSNLLVLDEPTNHLDLESRQTLARALNAYRGTLLLATHDRWLLDTVVTKVAVLGRRALRVFPGDFTEARTAALIEAFAVEKPTVYVVRKGFKDYEAGVRHAVGSRIALTPGEFAAKRLWATALAVGWMVPEDDGGARGA